MLHGVTMLQVEAMPIWLFLKVLALEHRPTACSIARLAARSDSQAIDDDGAVFAVP
jgi:hypothetical protein